MQLVSIETDATGAATLEAAVRQQPEVVFDTREVQAQVGDPDTWMFVAQMVPLALAALRETVGTLIAQRKIKYIKIGDLEFRDITPEQLQEVLRALGESEGDGTR
ncbi:hypothetical protein [Nocardia lijiangensis]|uniref:hypothetical protein n=1 Tax=Nocardia lijiangensis TaxID=299618 RepID=UPI000829B215|nr:hypothetical protein [Nocardia lijiangensis]